jgi:hypothetical protein
MVGGVNVSIEGLLLCAYLPNKKNLKTFNQVHERKEVNYFLKKIAREV